MNRLLTREELIDLDNQLQKDPYYLDLVKMAEEEPLAEKRYQLITDRQVYEHTFIAKSQDAKTIKKVVDIIERPMRIHTDSDSKYLAIRQEVWESIKSELGVK